MSVGCLVHWVRQVIHLSSGLSFSVIVHLLSRTDNLRLRRNVDSLGQDFCLARQHGSVNSILKKHLFTHFRYVSAVLAAIAFRTTALHRIAGRTFQQVLVLCTPASLSSKSQVISPSPYLWWHSWYRARYSYFTTITPTCLCNYRLYRTLWCGDTSVIPWPGCDLNN